MSSNFQKRKRQLVNLSIDTRDRLAKAGFKKRVHVVWIVRGFSCMH